MSVRAERSVEARLSSLSARDTLRDAPIAAAAALILALLASVGWYLVHQERRAQIEGETIVAAEQAADHLGSWVDARVAMVDQFAKRWMEDYQGRPQRFRRDALLFLDRLPGLQALNWMDSDWVIRVTVPVAGNEAALDQSLRNNETADVRESVARADRFGRPTRTRGTVELLQGGQGFTGYWPVSGARGERIGFVNAVFRIETLLELAGLVPRMEGRFRIALREAESDTIVFASEQGSWPMTSEREVPVLDRAWILSVAPNAQRLSSVMTDRKLTLALLGGSYSLCVLVGWLLFGLLRRRTELSQLARAMDQAREGVGIFDKKGHVIYLNRALSEGLSPASPELLGKSMLEVASDAGQRSLAREAFARLGAGEDWTGRYPAPDEQGGVRILDASIAPVRDRSNRISSFVGVARDVTREEALETQLHHSQKMEAVGRLAGGAAHDFNNLLTVISGYAERIVQGLDGPERLRESAEMILGASDRAAALVGQLLAVGRGQPRRPRVVALNDVVWKMAELLERLLGEDLTMHLKLDPALRAVEMDPAQIEQILINLCANARDALPSRGEVTVATEERSFAQPPSGTLPELAPGDYVELSVSDTGAGIDANLLPHIFEPFFTTKELGRGIGLGLATVYGIAEQNAGAVQVESVPGEGSRFSVLLPVSKAPLPKPTVDRRRVGESAPSLRSRGEESVLLVEDEDTIRRLVENLLLEAGYTVIPAQDGLDAIEQLRVRGGSVDLLLSDVVMPRMGGAELREHLSKLHPDLRVVFMSGYAATRLADESQQILAKPFTVEALLTRVREALDETSEAKV